ncbi:MAG: inorganic phosphate transporter [Anaerolineales bacterium]
MLTVVLVLALFNAFLAGFHGSAAVVATVISSRALTPRTALLSAALAAWLGPLLLGTAVANTISQQLIAPAALSLEVLVCGLGAAASWIAFTWLAGIPCSASQAVIGGLLGASITAAGFSAIQPLGLIKTLLGLFISPPLGLLAGLGMMQAMLALFRNATPRINTLFRRFQLVTTLALALTVGSNDVQKFMGLMALALLLAGQIVSFQIPIWVMLLSATAFALGMLSGGYRLIRTLGGRIFKIRPVHSLSAQLAAGMVVLVASLIGLPVSSTQVISTSVFGVGTAERLSKVRWQVAQEMLTAWVLTIPLTATLAGLGLWLWKGNGL